MVYWKVYLFLGATYRGVLKRGVMICIKFIHRKIYTHRDKKYGKVLIVNLGYKYAVDYYSILSILLCV